MNMTDTQLIAEALATTKPTVEDFGGPFDVINSAALSVWNHTVEAVASAVAPGDERAEFYRLANFWGSESLH